MLISPFVKIATLISVLLTTACSASFKVSKSATDRRSTEEAIDDSETSREPGIASAPETLPQLSFTAPQEAAADDKFNISWTRDSSVRDYDLVIANDPECKEKVIALERIKETEHTLRIFAPGTYYICLYANLMSGERLSAKNSGKPIKVIDTESVERPASPPAPAANAGDDLTARSSAALGGTATGDSIGIQWSQVSGPGTVTFSSAGILNPTVAADKDGVYTLRLTVQDKAGQTAADELILTWDTLAPDVPTGLTASPGLLQVSLTWNLPDPETDGAILLRREGSAVAWMPAGGVLYEDGIVDASNGTVLRNLTKTDLSRIDTGLTEGIAYHYALFVRDEVGNWSGPVAVSASSDATPVLSLSTPAVSQQVALGATSTVVNFSAADAESSATVSLYHSQSRTNCTSGLTGWTEITTGLPVSSASYTWDISALPAGSYAVCGKIDDGVNAAVYTLSPGDLRINTPPSVSLVEPAGSNDMIAQNGSFNITWTDSDPDDDAVISFYYAASATGTCSTGTIITGTESEDVDGPAGSKAWNTSGVAPGSYYICASISDGLSAAESWSDAQLTINARPAFSFVTPAGGEALGGNDVVISWTDSDPDNDAQISLYLKTNNSGSCTSGSSIATGLSEDAALNEATLQTTSVASNFYYICAAISDGTNPTVTVHSSRITLYRICIWEGAQDTNWGASANWSGCNSTTPRPADKVVIQPATPFQPLLTSDTTIQSFAPSTGGGGVLTISAGIDLTLTRTATFASSVVIKGDTADCQTCRVVGASDTIQILNDATLTLGRGVSFVMDFGKNFFIGTGTSAGHLATETTASGNQNEWPRFYGSNGTYGYNGFSLQGTSTAKSSLDVDGLRILNIGGNDVAGTPVRFISNYEIRNFDNVLLTSPFFDNKTDFLRVSGCTSSLFTDSNWDNIIFNDGVISNGIDASACSGITPITISGSGRSFGPIFENDPNSVINWINASTFTCTFTDGAGNGLWHDAGNWSGCANGRFNVPDQLDWVVIPPGNTVLIDKRTGVYGIAAGSGGTISIAPGSSLFFSKKSSNILGDVTLQGSVSGCSSCIVTPSSQLEVINNAKLTLGANIRIRAVNRISIRIGNGVENGHLATPATTPLNELPVFVNTDNRWSDCGEIQVNGATASGSSVDINGLNGTCFDRGSSVFDFVKNFTILNMNHIRSGFSETPNTSTRYVRLRDCTDATLSAGGQTWTDFNFVQAVTTGTNIDASGTGCLPAQGWTVTVDGHASSPGYGAARENDPANVVTWLP